MAVRPDGTVDNGPDITKAKKVGFFAPGGGAENFEQSFMGFLDRNTGLAPILAGILNLFTGGGLTGAAAAYGQTKYLLSQGKKGSEALFEGAFEGGAIGRHPIEATPFVALRDFGLNPHGILEWGKGVYKNIKGQVAGADHAIRQEFAPQQH